MARSLILFFNDLEEDIDFVLVDDDLPVACGHGLSDLKTRVAHLDAVPVIAVIPGEAVTSWRVKKPPGSRRYLEKALPFLLEEELASPPESIHVAPISVSSGEHMLVMVIDKALLRALLDRLVEIGSQCTRMIPDYLLLAENETTRVSRYNGRCIIRFSDGTGTTVSEEVLSSFNAEEWQIVDHPETTDLARAVHRDPSTSNLLQGPFRPPAVWSHTRYLKAVALILGLSAILHVGYFLGTGLYFHGQARAAHMEAERVYRELFPTEDRIVNIRRQMEGKLNRVQSFSSTDSFLELAAGIAHASRVDDMPTNARIEHLNFDAEQGKLIAALTVTDLADLQRFNSSLAHLGITVEVLGAEKAHDAINARIALRHANKP